MAKSKFWNMDHERFKEYLTQKENYIPLSGKTKYHETELLRAASKLIYDAYNNGWGCNNISGCLDILQQEGYLKDVSYKDLATIGGYEKYEHLFDDVVCNILDKINKCEKEKSFTKLKGDCTKDYGIKSGDFDDLVAEEESLGIR